METPAFRATASMVRLLFFITPEYNTFLFPIQPAIFFAQILPGKYQENPGKTGYPLFFIDKFI
jgi:hypothetical protein